MYKTSIRKYSTKTSSGNRAYLECRRSLLQKVISNYGLQSHIIPSNKIEYDVVDLFSGCGGMSHGFYEFGKRYGFYRHVAAFDIDKHSNSTFERNFGCKPFDYDLNKTTTEVIKKSIQQNVNGRKNPLIIIGCAPCQGFSAHRKKDPRKDKRNTLVKRFAEIAIDLKPKLIIMENVPDMLAEKHWHHYSIFHKLLENSGYKITTEIINMADYGVPQKRFRMVSMAAKSFVPLMPKPIFTVKNYRSVRDAIFHLPPLEVGEANLADPLHITSRHRKKTVELLSKIPKDGGSRPYGLGPKCLDRVSGFYDVYGRLFWDKPAVTMTARCRTPSCGRFTHPEQNRGLSVREAGLLQGFPADFVFEGPFDDKFKQIGNAVPPIFSVFLSVHIAAMLKGIYRDKENNITHITSPIAKSYSGIIADIKKKKKNNKNIK